MTMPGSKKMNPTATAGAAAAFSCHHTVCTVDTRVLVSISVWAVRLRVGRLGNCAYREAGFAAA